MKRSKMIENIASELIREEVNFPSWDKALKIADIILNRIETDGMAPPLDLNNIYMKYETDDLILITKDRKWGKE